MIRSLLAPLWATVLSVLCCLSLGAQVTRTVPSQFPSIQSAINACLNGDTVLVEPGTYDEPINLMGLDIRLASTQGAAVTILRGLPTQAQMVGLGRMTILQVPTGSTNAAVIDGFRFEQNPSVPPTLADTLCVSCGVGATPELLNLEFAIVNSGRVLGVESSTGVSLDNCRFELRGDDVIGAVGNNIVATNCLFTTDGSIGWGVVSGSFQGAQCRFIDCRGTLSGGAVQGSVNMESCRMRGCQPQALEVGGSLTNCAFTDCGLSAAAPGYVLTYTAGLSIRHCTFFSNYGGTTAPLVGILNGLGSAPCVMENSIVRNMTAPLLSPSSLPSSLTVSYSNIEGGWTGVGNMDAPSVFGPGLSLLPTSPEIDRAAPSSVQTDGFGAPRVSYFAPDMGLAEWLPPQSGTLSLSQPLGSLSFALNLSGTAPGATCITLFSTDVANTGPGAGQGPVAGLFISLTETLNQISTSSQPFTTTTDATGTYTFGVPANTLDPSVIGLTVSALTHSFQSSTGSVIGRSNVNSLSLY